MKKIISIFLFAILCIQVGHTQIRSKVDERFELTSIMFALAGASEYCQCGIPSYFDDINKELGRYYRSEPINYIRELAQFHRIGYDAVSFAGSILEIKNGEIIVQPQYDISKISEYDSRWTPELFSKYLVMVNKFYKRSNFHKFFETHNELYRLAEQQMDRRLEILEPQWFQTFYGQPLDSRFIVYICLNNGPNNYAIQDGILIGMYMDADECITSINPSEMFTIIHEFGHHYSTPLLNDYETQIRDASTKMFPYVKDMMARSAYGDATISLYEGFNNLFTLMYLRDSETINEMMEPMLRKYTDRGFIWLRRAVNFMENFYENRRLYPHIKDFMPQLVAFMNYTAENYDSVIKEFESIQPRVVDIYPAIGSDISNVDEVVITFSMPMHTDVFESYGNGTDDNNEQTKQLPIDFNKICWSEDGFQLKLILDKSGMKEPGSYGIELGRGFRSSDGYRLGQSQKLIFTVCEE